MGSFYAPTQDKPGAQVQALEELEQILQKTNASNTILAGDFNCFLDPLLDRNAHSSSSSHSEVVRDKIHTLLDDWGLCDMWRNRFPKKKGFTFHRGRYASRIDYCMVSHHLSSLVDSMRTEVTSLSDHAMLSCLIKTSKVTRGPGLWKFDSTLLENEDFNKKMSAFLAEWTPPPELTSPSSTWEWFKFEIKTFVMNFTKNVHSIEKQHIHALNKELQLLQQRMDEQGEDLTMQIESIMRELREVEESRARRLIFRAKSNWALYGERPSRYFLNLEKRNASDRTLTSLEKDGEDLVTEPKQILEIAKEYYTELYKGQEDQHPRGGDCQARAPTTVRGGQGRDGHALL